MMDEFDDQKSTQSVDEYWAMVLRRKWWILGPLFFGWLLVFASTWVLPAEYASASVVLIHPPKFPSTLVAPNVQADLAGMTQVDAKTRSHPKKSGPRIHHLRRRTIAQYSSTLCVDFRSEEHTSELQSL